MKIAARVLLIISLVVSALEITYYFIISHFASSSAIFSELYARTIESLSLINIDINLFLNVILITRSYSILLSIISLIVLGVNVQSKKPIIVLGIFVIPANLIASIFMFNIKVVNTNKKKIIKETNSNNKIDDDYFYNDIEL